MSLPVPDRERALEEMRDSASRWADLLRSVTDASRTAIGYWTVGDVAAHTTHIFQIFVNLTRGRSSPVKDHLRLAEHWDMELRNDEERELKVLADRVEESASALEAASIADRWEEQVTWHGGIQMPIYSLACIVVNECEIHGMDVAAAEALDWNVDRTKAILAVQGLLPALPYFVKPDVAGNVAASWELNLRGAPPVYLLLRNGRLEVTDQAPGTIDCRVTADPVEYLLVGYGRKSKWGPILTGKIVAYGKKPWLSLTLSKLFQTP
jgi:uncharacterized protein (TIGR03083 family)